MALQTKCSVGVALNFLVEVVSIINSVKVLKYIYYLNLNISRTQDVVFL